MCLGRTSLKSGDEDRYVVGNFTAVRIQASNFERKKEKNNTNQIKKIWSEKKGGCNTYIGHIGLFVPSKFHKANGIMYYLHVLLKSVT